MGRRLRDWGLAGARVAVGFSGGLDSTVLLHLLSRLAPALNLQLSAVHVHHGLHALADQWAESCRVVAADLGVPLILHRVCVRRDDPRGLEAAARTARHACYRGLLVDAVALAHHADDQAETVLLRLLRGAGVEGLAAMAAQRSLGPGAPRLVRPLLEEPRPRLEAWARQAGLRWVEDPSNADEHHARNYLRRQVLPVVAARHGAWRELLGRSARHAAATAAMLERLARLDLAGATDARGRLRLDALRSLDPASRANALRQWLRQAGLPALPERRLAEVLRQSLGAAGDTHPAWTLAGRSLLREEDCLCLLPPQDTPDPGWRRVWRGEPEIVLPDGARLCFAPDPTGGLRLDPESGVVWVGLRRGGERLRVAPGGRTRTLKNLLRERAVPAAGRDRIPLLWVGAHLVHVPGVGTDPDGLAAPGRAGWRVWLAAMPPALSGPAAER